MKIGTTEVTVSRYLKLSEPPRRAYNSQRKREKIEPFIPRINELGEQGYKNREIVRILKLRAAPTETAISERSSPNSVS